MNKIVYNGLVFNDDGTGDGKLLDGSFFVDNSLAHDELSVDTLKFRVRYPLSDKPDDSLVKLDYGTECAYYHDDILFGNYYHVKTSRISRFEYELEFQSSIGLLDDTNHYGGLYSGAYASDIISDVIGGKIPYTIKPVFSKIKLYGWLPVATRRSNLQQVLFSCGGCIKKNKEGNAYIATLDTTTPKVIPDNKVFDSGSITYNTNISSVAVTEHGYVKLEDTVPEKLFEGELIGSDFTTPKGKAVTNASLVTWSTPAYDITVSGTTLIESDVNYAIVVATPTVKVEGKKYLHTESVVHKDKPNYKGKEKLAEVKEATLISLANSGSTAERMMAYYGNSNTMTPTILWDGEKTTDNIQMTNPYGDQSTGFIKSIDGTFGAQITKGNCELVLNYVPPTVVGSRTLVSIEITTPPVQTAYATGDYFNRNGMVVTAKYDDNTTAIVSNYQVSPNTPLTLEDTKVTITYREIGVSASAEIPISVKNVLRKIEITTPPYTVDYYVDDTFDNTGMVVEAFYSDGSHKPVTTYTWQPTRALTEQDNTITVSYTEDGVTATTYQDITVGEAPDLVSIAITNPPDKTVYKLNEYFDRTGMIVTATFADGKSRIVSGYSVSPNGALGKTDTTITVSYTRKGITKTATQAITVVYLTSIVISNPPTYTEYYEGNSFNKAGMVVTAIYSNDTTVILKDTDYTVTPEVLDTHTTQVVITYSDNGITKTATQAVKVTYYPYDYTKSMVLSQSGTYHLSDLQATHRNIRIVTIAGGTGATDGEAGTAGGSSDGSRISRGSSGTDTSNPGAGGTGGHAGSGSSGGAVYSQDIVLDTNASDIVVTIGNGGANASYGGVGSTGGETKAVIDGVTISSNKGSSIDTGYQDIFTKIIYAKKGVNGVAGGNGGTGGNSNDGQSQDGTGVDSWTGGTGSSGWTLTTDYRDNKYTETHNTRERSTDKKSYKQQIGGWMEGYTNYRLNDDGTVSFSGKNTIGKTNSTTVHTGTIYQSPYTPSAPTSPSIKSIASHAQKITVSNPSKNSNGVLCYDEDRELHYWETFYNWTNNIVNVAAGYSRWGGTGAVYGSNGTNGGASAPTPPTPSAPNAPDTFGSGGNGGHGGAGGGGAPATRAEIENRGGSGNSVCNNSVRVSGQSGGSGSNGSAGTAGAQGCIIVYYS